MANQYFITATGTDIGKTYISCALIKDLVAQNKTVLGLKPIISGWEDYNDEMDTNKLLEAMGRLYLPDDIEIISPWRLEAPLSPDMAAKKEGREINFNSLVNFCKSAKEFSENLLIEGVGGVMVPINDKKTILDLIEAVQIPAILITGSYLGAISHTLTALATLQSRNIPVHRIIINESENSIDLDETKSTIRNFTDIKIEIVKRGGKISAAQVFEEEKEAVVA